MYETAEEANQKIVNSTVLFDGLPVQVTAAQGPRNGVVLTFAMIPYPRLGIKPESLRNERIDDPRWDFRTLGSRLGFVNIEKSPWDGLSEAVFCTRIPTRAARQGLDDRTARVNQVLPETVHPWTWNHLLYNDGLTKSIQRKYPSVKEAVTRLVKTPDKVKSIAIGRKIMLVFDRVNPPNLVYRSEKVGYVSDDVETFKLAPHKEFLKEELVDIEGLRIA